MSSEMPLYPLFLLSTRPLSASFVQFSLIYPSRLKSTQSSLGSVPRLPYTQLNPPFLRPPNTLCQGLSQHLTQGLINVWHTESA